MLSNLKKWRKKAGLTQIELAKTLGVAAATVAKWESGIVSITLRRLEQIASIYKITVHQLLSSPD